MKTRNLILALTGAFVIVGCGGGGTSESPQAVEADTTSKADTSNITTSNPYPAPYLSDDDRAVYLQVINDARSIEQDCGTKGIFSPAPRLQWSEALYGAAYEHSVDMAESDTFAHEGSGTNSDWTGIESGKKSTSQERIENNGYSDWTKVGENIAAGTLRDTAKEAVNAWLESDAHCAILMDVRYTDVGMAMVDESDSTYTYYWTQNFGNR